MIIAANGWKDSDVREVDTPSTTESAEVTDVAYDDSDDESRTEKIAIPLTVTKHGIESVDTGGDFNVAEATKLTDAVEIELSRRPSLLLGAGKDRLNENDPLVVHLKELWMQRTNAIQDLLKNIENGNDLIVDLQQIIPGFKQKNAQFWKSETTKPEARFKAYEKKLINCVAGHLQKTGACNTPEEAKEEARKRYRRAVVDHLNRKEWKVITSTIEYKGQHYAVVQTPAAQIKRGEHNIFENDYQGRGVSCGTSDCVEHATNLWLCELRAPDGKLLFHGVRTGVLSAYALELGSDARRQAAINRAKEVLSGALMLRQDLLRKALEGDTVTLPVVSTALLTPQNFGKQREGEMLDDQMAAWKTLSEQDSVVLKIRDEDGKVKPVHVKLELAAFNFGVNEMAMAGARFGIRIVSDTMLDMGWKHANDFNRTAMKILLGDPDASTPGGMVGSYLAKHPDASNAELVRGLTGQIVQIWKDESYRSDDNEVYKMTARIDLLGFLIGAAPHWNCKSGKDRTAGNASEILRAAIQLHQGEALMAPGAKLNRQQQELLKKTMLDSGNAEIQVMNTAAPGNKIMKKFVVDFLNLSHKKRIGGKEAFNAAKGLSSVVGA